MNESKEKKQKTAEIIVPNDPKMEKALGVATIKAPWRYKVHKSSEEIRVTFPYSIGHIVYNIAAIEAQAKDHDYNIRIEWY